MADLSDLSKHADPVARILLGDPNLNLSTKTELRFGNNGSVSVDLDKGAFFDHQEGEGGGVLWAVEKYTGHPINGGEAIDWLREKGFDVPDSHGGDANRGAQGGRADRPAPRFDPDGNWLPDAVPDNARLAHTYDYKNAAGDLMYQVCRYEWPQGGDGQKNGKHFQQRRPDPAKRGGWAYKMKGVDWLPYRLPELIDDIDCKLRIFIVEGEKKVDMMRAAGIPATCNHGGSGKFPENVAAHLAGADVTIIPDNDDPGRKHAQLVGARLKGVAKSVDILEIPNLPPKGSVDDWLPAGGGSGSVDQLFDLQSKLAKPWRPEPPKSSFKAVPWLQIPAPGPQLEYLIKGVLTRNELAMLVGESQSGKSFLAIDMAMSVARGVDWFGHRCRKAGVIYQAGESAVGVRRRRIPAYAQQHDCLSDDLPFVMLEGKLDLFSSDDHATNLTSEAIAWGAMWDVPLGLIVIDTFNRATPGANENDGRDMGAIIDRCEMIRAETGATVLLVHHMNAQGTRARGHTSLFAAVDSEIKTKKCEDAHDTAGRQVREWALGKQKDGADSGKGRFVLRQVQIGTDVEGDPITSCIVTRPESGTVQPAPDADKGVTLGEKPALLLRAIYEGIYDEGIQPPASLELADGIRVLHRKKMSKRMRSVLADDDGLQIKEGETEDDARRRKRDADRNAINRARDNLVTRGLISVTEDFVWLTGKRARGFGPPPGTGKADDPTETDAAPDVPADMEDFL